ncbi:NADP-dependent oxidoreductase [Gephyromycinifex aptenodytis]|uniref:NADP-dependent oxidoreductase n=1 Tax=Gephyromycinifex aptenodytis TaxID=2716227 RepID=UPI0014474E5D|nr:NADP-dependent oxidoreductase [Gephyromycinifex aptenodytis]
MRAAQIDRFGGPEELHVVTDAPTPTPGQGEVLVRVLAAGVNPLDYKIRDGSSGLAAKLTADGFPLILGRECCGVIEQVGPGVSDFAVGTRVFGMAPLSHRGECYAEFVALPASALAPAPASVDPQVLAGTALVGLTAWVAVHDLARVTADDTVLVHGGAGGVGQVVVQLCVAAGARVYATASTAKRSRIEEMGAIHVDYTQADFTQVTPRPDVIIDGVYFSTYEPSMDHLAEGGRLVILPSLADLEPARARGINVAVPTISPDRERLAALATELEQGRLTIALDRVFPLTEAAAAHRLVEEGHTQGKVVLEVAND